MSRPPSPIARGSALAIAAAVLFGATTPLVTYFGAGVGPFATGTLLYSGAAAGAGLSLERAALVSLRRTHALRVLAVATFGAALAPASLAWGLQNTGALAASLLLNLEAVFTVLLALAIHRESIGSRVWVAVALMVAGGALLGLRAGEAGTSSALGLAAIAFATFGWALDNTLTSTVVFAKAGTGALLSASVALTTHDAWPGAWGVLGLLFCGAAGYGFSLRLYLGAQRILGAGRTGSLFAFAPFVGAGLAFALGDRNGLALVVGASVLFAAAVYLHLTEKHSHRHAHEPVEHEHAHRHDDGHHGHEHDPPVQGEHSHAHRHEVVEHEHEHGADVHHRHQHP
jgi:drug/metabolite transporter (DMT)-like permease